MLTNFRIIHDLFDQKAFRTGGPLKDLKKIHNSFWFLVKRFLNIYAKEIYKI